MSDDADPNEQLPDHFFELVNKLTPTQKEGLRRKLNQAAWFDRFQKVHDAATRSEEGSIDTEAVTLGRKVSAIVQHVIDRLESGEIDEDMKQSLRGCWEIFLQSVREYPAAGNTDLKRADDPASLLEKTYQDLQNNLIQVRQAVAQAIASERQLNLHVKKNEEQAEIWQGRLEQALQQGNGDLAKDTQLRCKQYKETARRLAEELKVQTEATLTMRERLHQLEYEVQRAYTKKQVLIARDNASKATMAMEGNFPENGMSRFELALEAMERQVLEREITAVIGAQMSQNDNASSRPDILEIVNKAAVSIDRLALLVEKMEQERVQEKSKSTDRERENSRKDGAAFKNVRHPLYLAILAALFMQLRPRLNKVSRVKIERIAWPAIITLTFAITGCFNNDYISKNTMR